MHSTRIALFAIPFALLMNACATHQFANGSVSYTSTPPIADHSGALPLSPLVCLKARDGAHPNAAVRLGQTCSLAGIYDAHGGRGAPPGGESKLYASGPCAVPTSAGPLPLSVQNTTLQVTGDAIDVTVGGVTNDGRYLTYRFTGMLGADDPTDACDEILEKAR